MKHSHLRPGLPLTFGLVAAFAFAAGSARADSLKDALKAPAPAPGETAPAPMPAETPPEAPTPVEPSAPETAVEAPPAAAAAPADLALEATGISVPTVVEGRTWVTLKIEDNSGQPFDMLLSEGTPVLGMRVEAHSGNTCLEARAWTWNWAGSTVESPGYLPAGYDTLVKTETAPSDAETGLVSTVFCADTQRGALIVSVNSHVYDRDEYMRAANPMLRALVAAAAPGATSSGASTTDSSSTPDYDSSSSRGMNLAPSRAHVGLRRLVPDLDVEPQWAGFVGVDGYTVTGAKTAGLALGYRAMAGYGEQDSLHIDGRLGLGLALRFGRNLALGALFDVGVDGITGAEANEYRLPFAGYYGGEARVRLIPGGKVALEVGGMIATRGSDPESVTVEVPPPPGSTTGTTVEVPYDTDRELRIDARLCHAFASTEGSVGFGLTSYAGNPAYDFDVGFSF